MGDMKTIRLAQKKEKAVLRRHPWIFSGAIQETDPDVTDGDIVSVCDSSGRHLGYGYYNGKTQIAVRMLSFGNREITPDYLIGLVRSAAAKRVGNPLLRNTDSYRLIFSEGDSLPGLIVDSYGRHLVMQCLTLGMEKLKEQIVPILIDVARPESIFERSEHEGRALEGLPPMQGQVYGTTPWDVIINENGMSFYVNILSGQKTGFYLDQRDNRALVKALARGRSVLNLFSYTGGFSVAAGLGGAKRILSVDASADALAIAEKNADLNRLNAGHETVRADIFQYLQGGADHGRFHNSRSARPCKEQGLGRKCLPRLQGPAPPDRRENSPRRAGAHLLLFALYQHGALPDGGLQRLCGRGTKGFNHREVHAAVRPPHEHFLPRNRVSEDDASFCGMNAAVNS